MLCDNEAIQCLLQKFIVFAFVKQKLNVLVSVDFTKFVTKLLLVHVVIVKAFECKIITGMKLEGILSSNEKHTINTHIKEINSDHSE